MSTGLMMPGRPRVASERFRLLHHVFEAQADARSEVAAVVQGGVQVTYLALDCYANRIAHHLRRRGVKAGDRVALSLPPSVDGYAALLGALKAGGAYVQLDPEDPPERVAYILEDCEAAVLVTTEEVARRQVNFTGSMVLVDADRFAIDAESCLRLPPEASKAGPNDLCCVLYPSGSTERPNGVRVTHASYQGSPLTCDTSIRELWLAFRAGAALEVAIPETADAGPAFRHGWSA